MDSECLMRKWWIGSYVSKSVSGVTMTSNECTNQILTRKQKRKSGCVILGASMGSFVFWKNAETEKEEKKKSRLDSFYGLEIKYE